MTKSRIEPSAVKEDTDTREQVLLSALLMLLGSTVFVTIAALVKLASEEASAMQAVLYRSFFSGLVLWTGMKATHVAVFSRRWPLLAVRGLLGFLALFFYFYAVTHTELANALSLQQLSPIFVALLSVWLLGEHPRPGHYLLAGLCLVGALLIIQPNRGLVSLPVVAGLLSAIFSSGAYIAVRALTRTEPTLRIVFWFSLSSTLLSLPFVVPGWHWLNREANLLLILVGLLAALAQGLMTASYRRAPAHMAAAFSYANVPLAYLIGLLLWGERPNRLAHAGIALIVGGGVLLLLLFRHPEPSSNPASSANSTKEGLEV